MADISTVPSNPPAAYRHYKPAEVAEALRNAKGMVSVAARVLGCEPVTIRQHIKKHPTVRAAIDEARALTTDVAELSLFKAIQAGEPWAVKFYLSTIGKDRGYTEYEEGAGGHGVTIIRNYIGVKIGDD